MDLQTVPEQSQPTIVFISHRSDLREHAAKALREKGYRVAVPQHRQNVFEVVEAEHPSLLVLDLYVSEPSGADVLDRLRAQGYGEKVIVLADRSSRAVLPRVYNLGIDQVVQVPPHPAKGFDLDPLESAVRRALARTSQA